MEDHLYKDLYDLENEHWWFVAKRRIVLSLVKKYLPARIGNKILDVGCGSGLMLNALREYGTVYGIDYSDEALKFSALNFNGELKKGFLPGGIPYPENYFDLIVALDILEHVEDDTKSINDIKKHLNKNGICIITVPSYMFLWSNHDVVHEHKRRYTIKNLQQKLLSEDLRILKLSYYNSLLFGPIFITRMVHRLLKIDNGSDAKMPNQYLNHVFMSIFTFEAFLLKIFTFRFGVSLIAVLRKDECP